MQIQLKNINKYYGTTHILKNINLELESSKQLVIRGPSGSGKSTLLYLMGGLDRPTEGRVIIEGNNLNEFNDKKLAYYRNQTVGFIFQFHFLLNSMNCLDNILLPSKIGHISNKLVMDRVVDWGRELGVLDCFKKLPHQLSGGEQQRINIIRALSLHPKILLCDEPTGNLDSVNSQKVTEILKELSQNLKTTLIIVTHDKRVASHFENEIVIEDGIIA
jgi:lipoprotein-releasing system ATP-binding protein